MQNKGSKELPCSVSGLGARHLFPGYVRTLISRQVRPAICAMIIAWPATEATAENGLVLVLNHSSGSFEAQRSNSSFARHFGPGGVPLLSEEPDLPTEQVMHLAPVQTPRVIPRPEVLAAIDDVGMRYAGHPSLRAAGMSVTEWLSFFRANIEIESGYRQTAVSSVGAIGLGQLMPATAAKLGVNPNDMHQNLDGSARYMLMLLGRFGSKELALAGYNAGPGAVEQYGGIPPYPETQGHVRKVMSVFQKLTLATAE